MPWRWSSRQRSSSRSLAGRVRDWMPCFQRILGAANGDGASEAGGWKHKLENANLSRNLRATMRSGIGARLRVCLTYACGRAAEGRPTTKRKKKKGRGVGRSVGGRVRLEPRARFRGPRVCPLSFNVDWDCEAPPPPFSACKLASSSVARNHGSRRVTRGSKNWPLMGRSSSSFPPVRL